MKRMLFVLIMLLVSIIYNIQNWEPSVGSDHDEDTTRQNEFVEESVAVTPQYLVDINHDGQSTRQEVLIEEPVTTPEYNRKNWKHWVDADHDGQSTRQEVLIEENLAPPESTVYENNKIVKGLWVCMYTGDTITNPRELDVDHFIPLKEVWLSGGYNWYPSQKETYANYLDVDDHLIAVKAGANRSKGARDPSGWMPDVNQCWYLRTWVHIKDNWELTMDDAELRAIDEYNEEYGCY